LSIDANTSRKLLADIEYANSELRAGRRVDAVLAYEKIAKRDDLDAVVHIALGRLSLAMEGSFQAVEHFQQALEREPDNAVYQGYLGLALQKENRTDDAGIAFEKAMLADDVMPAVLNGLGIIYMNRRDYEQAKEILTRAVTAKPSEGAIQSNLATTLARLGEHDLAIKHAEKGLKHNPDSLTSHYAYGNILAEQGRVDEAVRHFEKTIRQHKHFGGAYDHLARLKKFSATDRPFIEKTEKALQGGMPAQDRLCLHFALGKMYDDCQEWDKSFEHYRQANLLKKKAFDMKTHRTLFAQFKKTFNSDSLKKFQELGNPSEIPVFIVGMPRSGTTLMERMITSSDRAAGAGELPEIPRIAELLAPADEPRKVAAALHANLTAENVANYAEEYLRILRQADPDADRIVDKLPENYFYVWLIAILFPKATIIFAQRHPLDVCLSCFFQNFGAIQWADDLSQIGETYRFHLEVMDYWGSILPDGKIVDVHYEQLVEDPETHGGKMLQHCGLEWSGDGLDNYKKGKVVKTASLWQVRQPVYQSSKARWKNYAPHVADLSRQLSDFLQDDRDELAKYDIELPTHSGLGRLKRLFS
jgi:tetratricopeptide (TPR) repeat protein